MNVSKMWWSREIWSQHQMLETKKEVQLKTTKQKVWLGFGILYTNDIHSCFAHWQIMTCNWGIQTWWVKRSEAKVKPCIIIRRDRCMNLSQIFSILSVWGIPLEFKSLTSKDFSFCNPRMNLEKCCKKIFGQLEGGQIIIFKLQLHKSSRILEHFPIYIGIQMQLVLVHWILLFLHWQFCI